MDTNIREVVDMYVDTISSVSGVSQIYLFGSHAYGAPHDKSDIDLMVIVDDNLKAVKKSIEINSALSGKRKIPLDILVNTFTDFHDAINEPSLQKRIKNEGVLLYGSH